MCFYYLSASKSFLVSIFLKEHFLTRHVSSPEMAEKVDEFVRSENVLVTMDKRTLKKQRSRLQSKSEVDAPKFKHAPPPPPLPPPPTMVVSNLPIRRTKKDGEQPVIQRADWGDWIQEIKQRRTTLK